MWRAAGVIAAGLVCASAVVAADGAAGAAPATPSPIEAAKRDYDAIKDAKFSLEQQKLDLPKATAPELRLGNDVPVGDLGPIAPGRSANDKSKPAAQGRGQRGTNWLVDAMLGDKDKAGTKTGGATTLQSDADRADAEETGEFKPADLSAKKLSAADSAVRRGGKAEVIEDKSLPRVANPLDGFLSGWMTPGDYRLLKPTTDAGGAPSPSLAGTIGSVDNSGARDGVAHDRSGPAAEPRVNPYLAEPTTNNLGFSAPVLPSPSPGSGPAPQPIPAPMTPPAARVENVPPKTGTAATASELIKARDDEKYFPQLKRF